MPKYAMVIDKKFEETLSNLRRRFGLSQDAEVIRKAVALLKVAVDAEDRGDKLVIKKSDGSEQEIELG